MLTYIMNWKTVALILSICMSSATAATNHSLHTSVSLNVMSFNIRYGTAGDGENSWSNRRDLVIDLIYNQHPDIIGMQEALRFQLDYIKEELPAYGEIGVGRNDGLTSGEYSAILYLRNRYEVIEQGTFWFSDAPEVAGSMNWGNQITRICTWARMADRLDDSTFYIYNLHLDHRSQESRERSVELLAERIRDRTHPDPVIVTGDFNAGEENPAIRYLKGEIQRASVEAAPMDDRIVPDSPALTDTFRLLHPEATDVGTFNGFRGTVEGEKIDYILVSTGWDVLKAEIVQTSQNGRYPSDHFPVTAVIWLSYY